ncbi:MAG: ABC transporter substrate-binding protein [Clostridia bacterium]|jgi:NitT/TauT family transport system substrate-binding protein|nr:ABC transporter substrate-binding protein [Clostridia bacterium]
MKRIVSLVLAALMIAAAFALVGCNKADNTTLRIAALKGPTGMGIAPLMNKETYANYDITIGSDPSAVTSSFIAGEYDIACVPVNVAAVLYNKLEGDVVMLAINTLGVMYVLESGEEINSMADLSGKTLYATGQGSTPEFVLNYLLEKNGLTDVTVEYKAEHSELATLMADGSVTLGMLPEPNVTATMAKNDSLRVALDLTAEWNKVSDTKLVQGVIIARRSFVNEHKNAIKQFMDNYGKAVELVNTASDEACQMIVDAGILPAAPIAKAAIPRCNIVFITGDEMKASASALYEVFFAAEPKSVGGKLPAEDLYY